MQLRTTIAPIVAHAFRAARGNGPYGSLQVLAGGGAVRDGYLYRHHVREVDNKTIFLRLPIVSGLRQYQAAPLIHRASDCCQCFRFSGEVPTYD